MWWKIYKEWLLSTRCCGYRHTDNRTGELVVTHIGPVAANIRCKGALPMIDNRWVDPVIAYKEAMWITHNIPKQEFSEKFSFNIWDKFKDGADYSLRAGEQWRKVIESLQADPTKRRGVVSLWDAEVDLTEPNPPCILGYHFYIINGALNMTLILRSSDLLVGLPMDVMTAAFVLDAVAAQLNMFIGDLAVIVSNLHYYETNAWPDMDKAYPFRSIDMPGIPLFADMPICDRIQMVKWSTNRISERPPVIRLGVVGGSDGEVVE